MIAINVFRCDICLRRKVDFLKLIRSSRRNRSSQADHSRGKDAKKVAKTYTHTVILPKTEFPLRIDSKKRIERDSFIFERCKFSSLYAWQREHVSGREFVLHDGPPYANGKPHMGHAINKILKDITNRHHLLLGHKVDYTPGWDCHGLPIEHKVLSESERISAVEVRARARKFAEAAIADQLSVFRSWGVMADWEKCYFTFDKEYIKQQFHLFFRMYEKGLIYRSVKPVFWSPSSRTALAESELEYNPNHRSTAVIARLAMVSLPDSINAHLPSQSSRVYALVWTTTPWTLPANQAVCYNPTLSYCVVGDGDQWYILASEQVEEVQQKLGRKLRVLHTFPGAALSEARYKQPFSPDQELPFLSASHVTTGKGTGLVHTSPAHGPDDFLVALEHQIAVLNVVDEAGCYTEAAGPSLQGLAVLSSGSDKVLQLLERDILHSEDYVHSYPYDWRTKQPVILRASQQWFIDTAAIKSTAVENLKDVKIFPERGGLSGGVDFLSSQLKKRPYWCISRQRVWGVPIPVLYDSSTHTALITRELIDHFCRLLEDHGPDFWWTQPLHELAPRELLPPGTSVDKGKDILDIWFDSGVSWSHVLGEERVADLYLEGVDQFNGWFQSSLMTSVAIRNKSPYRALFVHGFAVDENGLKMSKSLGNVVNPEDITHGGKESPVYGIDTLRWWVACHATQHSNIPVSSNVLQASADAVHKIRIVLRFLLGALNDFNPETEQRLYLLDHYLLHLLLHFNTQVQELYSSYQYNAVSKLITNFVTNEVSALYCHLTKDRLYCSAGDCPSRRACQLVMKHILDTVTVTIAPILPFLAEEVFLYHPWKGDRELLFFSPVESLPEEWYKPEVACAVQEALKARQLINKTTTVANTWELEAAVIASGESWDRLQSFSSMEELSELLQVSTVSLIEGASHEDLRVELNQARHHLCARCRRWTSHSTEQLCSRCQQVVDSLPAKHVQAVA